MAALIGKEFPYVAPIIVAGLLFFIAAMYRLS